MFGLFTRFLKSCSRSEMNCVSFRWRIVTTTTTTTQAVKLATFLTPRDRRRTPKKVLHSLQRCKVFALNKQNKTKGFGRMLCGGRLSGEDRGEGSFWLNALHLGANFSHGATAGTQPDFLEELIPESQWILIINFEDWEVAGHHFQPTFPPSSGVYVL